MHEGQFTEKIVAAILEALKVQPPGKVRSVNVKVGEVFHLEPDSVQMHFGIAVQGTPLEGVRLDIQEDPVKVTCLQCQKTGTVEDHHLMFCPFCQSLNVKAVSGQTITVESIELES